jgi:fluoride exporter
MWGVEGWHQVALLSIGGSLGVNARYWLGVAISRWAGPQFPWATLAINVSGSFAIGLLAVLLARWLPHPNLRLVVVVGFLGGYTTFSSFTAEALVLWERGERALGAGYVAGSVGAGLAAVVLGTALGRGLIETSGRWSARDGRAAAVAAPGSGSKDAAAVGRREPSSRTSPDRAGNSEAPP